MKWRVHVEGNTEKTKRYSTSTWHRGGDEGTRSKKEKRGYGLKTTSLWMTVVLGIELESVEGLHDGSL